MARMLSAFALALALGSTAHSQLVGLDHVWTVPGLMRTSGGIGTVIGCTNGTTTSQTIGVEVYGSTGTFVSDGSLSVGPAATVLFATGSVTGLALDVNLGTGTVTKGHGRVMASTTRGILCSAFLTDDANGVLLTNLTIAKAFKQKGD